MSEKSNYEQGFINKCAEYGVDPEELVFTMEKAGAIAGLLGRTVTRVPLSRAVAPGGKAVARGILSQGAKRVALPATSRAVSRITLPAIADGASNIVPRAGRAVSRIPFGVATPVGDTAVAVGRLRSSASRILPEVKATSASKAKVQPNGLPKIKLTEAMPATTEMAVPPKIKVPNPENMPAVVAPPSRSAGQAAALPKINAPETPVRFPNAHLREVPKANIPNYQIYQNARRQLDKLNKVINSPQFRNMRAIDRSSINSQWLKLMNELTAMEQTPNIQRAKRLRKHLRIAGLLAGGSAAGLGAGAGIGYLGSRDV
jgi:L-rhamnose mutarotase